MPEQTLKEKTAKGLFWGGISNGLQQILGLVFGIVLARILSPEDYGMVGMLAIFTGIAGTIQDSGFSTALVNQKEIKPEDYNAVFWFNVFSGCIMYLILFFAAPLIACFYNKPELLNLSRFVFLGFLFGSVGIAHSALLSKKMQVKEKAQIDIISLTISGILGLTMAVWGLGYWGLAIQSTTYIIIGTLLRWHYSNWRPSFKINFIPLKKMFGFSIKLLLTNIFSQINNNIFSVLLGKFYNAQQVGYYSQGNKWMSMGSSFVSSMIIGIAQPVLVQVNDDKERQIVVFRKMVRFGSFVSFPLILGLAFVAKEFILVAVGEKWIDSVLFLQLFCIWGSVGYLWILYINLLMTHGKSNLYMWGTIIIGILQLIIVGCMFSLGIIPMVIGYISIYFVGLLIWQHHARNLIGIRLLSILKDIFPYLAITLVCFCITAIVTSEIQNIYILLIFKILLSAVLYILLMRIFDSTIYRECVNYLLKRTQL